MKQVYTFKLFREDAITMESNQRNQTNGSVIELLEQMLETEQRVISMYQHRTHQVMHPDVRSMLQQLVARRFEHISQIRDQLVRLKSEFEVTEQINELYR